MFKENQRKTIGIDARFYGPVGKGLGRYTQEIVDRVIAQDKINNYVIFLGRDNFVDFVVPNQRVRKVLAPCRWYSFAEQIVMPLLIARAKVDLMHFPHFNVPLFCPTKFVVTIHDLILTKHHTNKRTTLLPLFYYFKLLAYWLDVKVAIARAQKIIAVSEFTKNDIVAHFKIKPGRVMVIYEGVADFTKNLPDCAPLAAEEALARYQISGDFLLYVGNAYPHKNLKFLLAAMTLLLLEMPTLKLVLVGKDDYFYRQLKSEAKSLGLWQENINGPVIFAGYVPDCELHFLFNLAAAYVFPSLYEGFGLPPLEAMAHGCPVISSYKTSMPEILGEAAIYFDPEQKQDFVDKVFQVLTDQELRQELIDLGYRQIKKYDWDKAAGQTKNVYLGALNH